MELTAVIAILAVVATATIGRFSTGTLQNCAAAGFARTFAVDLLQARRRAIATGQNHYLSVTNSGGNVASYVMYRDTTGADTIVDKTRTIPAGVTATASHTTLEYDFDGASLAAYTMTITGPTRTWAVSTTMATGAVSTTITP